MSAIEFETELSGGSTLHLPAEVARQLPASGHARVIVVVADDPEDTDWRKAAYERFMRDDDPEDAVYDRYQ